MFYQTDVSAWGSLPVMAGNWRLQAAPSNHWSLDDSISCVSLCISLSLSFFLSLCRAVKFSAKLMGQAMAKRVKATILFATETGKSHDYAKTLCEIFKHAFDAKVHLLLTYIILFESWSFCVTLPTCSEEEITDIYNYITSFLFPGWRRWADASWVQAVRELKRKVCPLSHFLLLSCSKMPWVRGKI